MRTKVCVDCSKEKDIKNFYTETRSRDGYKKRCKKCETLRRLINKVKKFTDDQNGLYICERYWEKTYSEDFLSKIFECDKKIIVDYLKKVGIYNHDNKPCGKCGNIKKINDFPKGQRNFSGWCFTCQREYNKQYNRDEINSETARRRASDYYYDNYEHGLECRKNYYYNNRSELLQRSKIYRENNKEKISETHSEYYLKNSERIKENAKRWREENPIERLMIGSKYRAKQKSATVKWANLDKIKELYLEARKLTEETGIQYAVDHIIPLSHDKVCGLHVENNLQIIPFSDNCKKYNKFEPLIEYF